MATKHLHHIIPKHAGGSDDPSNLVELTIEEHADAHKKLYEKYGRWQDKIAWLTLSGQIGKEEARIQAIREGIKTRDMSYFKTEEWSKRISNANTGKRRTPEQIKNYSKPKSKEHSKKLAEHLKTIPWTEERKNKISETLKKKHKCPYCDFESNSSHVTRHIKRVHNK